jgi:two-component system sensor histidine kinase UhpB
LEDLRHLARGIYPPLLADQGCTLEALQNLAKYAAATKADVRLAATNGSLTFEVVDDWRGFDVATAKRGAGLTKLGLGVRTGRNAGRGVLPGTGTVIRGHIPTRTP